MATKTSPKPKPDVLAHLRQLEEQLDNLEVHVGPKRLAPLRASLASATEAVRPRPSTAAPDD